jgi:hypothetical protein
MRLHYLFTNKKESIPMLLDTQSLIWLFPLAFILHDFEEIIFFEPWLNKNAPGILSRLQNRLPIFLLKQIEPVLKKSTSEFAFSVSLIFCLVASSSFIAVFFQNYGFFSISQLAIFPARFYAPGASCYHA